jgi:hypothetical protein
MALLPIDPLSFQVERFSLRRQAQFAEDIRLMPQRIRQSRRRSDFPIQHSGALVVVPPRLQIPDVTLCLS